MFMHYMDFMSGCLLFIMVFDLESACRSKVENGTIHTAGGIKKERGIKGARKWNQRNMVSEQLQNNISKHIGSHKFPPTPPLTSIEGKGSQNSVQPIRKMKKSKTLGILLFYQRFINQIREESQQISKSSHIDHSTFPCFLNPEMVQAGKTRPGRKELSSGQKTWVHSFPPECCLCLGKPIYTLIPRLKDSIIPHH